VNAFAYANERYLVALVLLTRFARCYTLPFGTHPELVGFVMDSTVPAPVSIEGEANEIPAATESRWSYIRDCAVGGPYTTSRLQSRCRSRVKPD
jgi:hypothetical protein